MGNENHNKLFTLSVGIKITMSYIIINMFILSWNRNRLLQITKLILLLSLLLLNEVKGNF